MANGPKLAEISRQQLSLKQIAFEPIRARELLIAERLSLSELGESEDLGTAGKMAVKDVRIDALRILGKTVQDLRVSSRSNGWARFAARVTDHARPCVAREQPQTHLIAFRSDGAVAIAESR